MAMRKAISLEELIRALTHQRAYMLALANTDLNDYQTKALFAIYNENVALVNLFDIPVPDLLAIAKEHNEVAYLEQLYRRSPDGEESLHIEAADSETTSQQEITGSARMDDPEIRGDEA